MPWISTLITSLGILSAPCVWISTSFSRFGKFHGVGFLCLPYLLQLLFYHGFLCLISRQNSRHRHCGHSHSLFSLLLFELDIFPTLYTIPYIFLFCSVKSVSGVFQCVFNLVHWFFFISNIFLLFVSKPQFPWWISSMLVTFSSILLTFAFILLTFISKPWIEFVFLYIFFLRLLVF